MRQLEHRYNTDETPHFRQGVGTDTRRKRAPWKNFSSFIITLPFISSWAISDENGFQRLIIWFLKSQSRPNFKPLCHWGNSASIYGRPFNLFLNYLLTIDYFCSEKKLHKLTFIFYNIWIMLSNIWLSLSSPWQDVCGPNQTNDKKGKIGNFLHS